MQLGADTMAKRRRKKPNGSGSITKLKGNRAKPYHARSPMIEVAPGEFKRISLGTFKTVREAEQALANWEELYTKKTEKKYTLKEVYDLAIKEYMELEKVEEKSLNNYEACFKRLKSLYDINIADLSVNDFQEVFNNMVNLKTGEPLRKTSKDKTKSVLSVVYKYALKNRFVDFDCSQYVMSLSSVDKKEVKPVLEEDIQKLFEFVDYVPYVDAIIVLLYTGMRPSELFNCTIDNTDLVKRCFKGVGAKTEKGKARIIPIPIRILPIVERMYTRANKYLVETVTGGKMTADNFNKKYFKQALESCGISVDGLTPYSCRHSFADMLRRKNVSVEDRIDLMGHVDHNTTIDNYYSMQFDLLLNVVDKL